MIKFMFVYALFCLLVGLYARKLDRNPFGWFLLAAVLDPFLTGAFLFLLGTSRSNRYI